MCVSSEKDQEGHQVTDHLTSEGWDWGRVIKRNFCFLVYIPLLFEFQQQNLMIKKKNSSLISTQLDQEEFKLIEVNYSN